MAPWAWDVDFYRALHKVMDNPAAGCCNGYIGTYIIGQHFERYYPRAAARAHDW